MDFKGMCPIRADRMAGYLVICKKEGKEDTWYHMKNLKRLIKFIKNVNGKGIKFEIYHCSSKKLMVGDMLNKVMNIGKTKKEKLMLDDN